jgi:hypothetical protein
MKSIKVYKGMQFNGFNGYYYEVTKDATINVETTDIDEFIGKLKSIDGLQLLGKATDDILAHDLFLFRLAVVIKDEDVIFTNGTFTWLDDVYNLTMTKTKLVDPIANSLLNVLCKLLDWFNDEEVTKARELPNVDVLNTEILDAAYDLYTDLVERMLTV